MFVLADQRNTGLDDFLLVLIKAGRQIARIIVEVRFATKLSTRRSPHHIGCALIRKKEAALQILGVDQVRYAGHYRAQQIQFAAEVLPWPVKTAIRKSPRQSTGAEKYHDEEEKQNPAQQALGVEPGHRAGQVACQAHMGCESGIDRRFHCCPGHRGVLRRRKTFGRTRHPEPSL